jgi:hypothetical protein
MDPVKSLDTSGTLRGKCTHNTRIIHENINHIPDIKYIKYDRMAGADRPGRVNGYEWDSEAEVYQMSGNYTREYENWYQNPHVIGAGRNDDGSIAGIVPQEVYSGNPDDDTPEDTIIGKSAIQTRGA